MLVLTRRVGEAMYIADNIKITVLGMHGNQIRIGVEAPEEISVHREEVYERIQKENAAKSGKE